MEPNFYVITGGPGVGKTTLLQALAEAGYKTEPEVAREIIKQQIQEGGEALPWKDRVAYTHLMINASVESYVSVAERCAGMTVFFDRGLPDAFCYAEMIGMDITESMRQKAERCRYNKRVFLLPPWKEIYETDSERKQDWAEAVYTSEVMRRTYQKLGYHVQEVPCMSVAERVDFIRKQLSVNS